MPLENWAQTEFFCHTHVTFECERKQGVNYSIVLDEHKITACHSATNLGRWSRCFWLRRQFFKKLHFDWRVKNMWHTGKKVESTLFVWCSLCPNFSLVMTFLSERIEIAPITILIFEVRSQQNFPTFVAWLTTPNALLLWSFTKMNGWDKGNWSLLNSISL